MPNILYITHRVPYPPDKGDRIRNWNLLKFLAERGDVHLATLADEPVTDEARQMLEGISFRARIVPSGGAYRKLNSVNTLVRGRSLSEGMFASGELSQTIDAWASETRFDLAVASSSSVAPYLRSKSLADATKIVDMVDVDSQKWADFATSSRFPMSRVYQLEAKRVTKLEKEIADWADAVTLVSDAESDTLRHQVPQGRIVTATNGVDLDYFQPQPVEKETGLVFVGALDYKPNVDACEWFCRDVWPAIREDRPLETLTLVGRNPAKIVQNLSSLHGVHVTGTVPDVRPFVATAAVVIAPLRMGRGLQNKVLEAMAMGKAVVAGPSALAGFRRETEVPVLCAESTEDWKRHLLRLLENAGLRKELGERGRRYAETWHDWNACLQPFAEFIDAPQEAVVA